MLTKKITNGLSDLASHVNVALSEQISPENDDKLEDIVNSPVKKNMEKLAQIVEYDFHASVFGNLITITYI